MSKAILLVYIFFSISLSVKSQCPVADFETESTVCINQSLNLKNTSTDASKYYWDLCSGDLERTSSASMLSTITQSTTPTGMTLVMENLTWYIFVTSRGNNSIQRIELGSNLDGPITSGQVTNLPNSNFTNRLNGPEAIAFIKEGTVWYGVVANYNNNQLLLLDFGTSITNNSPTTTTIQIPAGVSLSQPSEINILQQGSQYFLFVGNRNTTRISRLVFNNSINSNPVAGADINVAGSSSLRSLSVVKDCDSWYLFAASENSNKIHRLDFGSDLGVTTTSIVKTDLVLSGDALGRPMRIKVINENSNYYALISSTNKFFRIKIGLSVSSSNASVSDLGGYGSLFKQTLAGFDFVSENSAHRGFFISSDFRELYRVNFLSDCFANMVTSESAEPDVHFEAPGNFHISLTVENSSGYIDYTSQAVTVSAEVAPEIDFSSNGKCVDTPVEFLPESPDESSITDWLWVLGDGDSATVQSPSHQYTSTGIFNVTLMVTSNSGCKNQIAHSVEVFNSPQAGFLLPPDNPLCTNQLFTFINTSTYDPASNPSWEWLINDSVVSVSETLLYSFTTTIVYDVKLRTSIPGCQDEIVESINSLVQAPLVDFTFAGSCQDELITFTNNTDGNVATYTWNFGDGQSSSDVNPQHAYSSSDQFNVELIASTSEGCNNSTSKQITIYSKPQPDFTMALPPFSCNGTPTQFNDNTPSPDDSNITFWSWNFGDPGSSENSASVKNPQHTYAIAGDYTVSLVVTTNYNCSNFIEKTVTISQTPVADFNYTPPCRKTPVTFSNIDNNISAWHWQIGNTQFFSENPSYTFLSPGTYNVSLTVTGTNNCSAYTQKTITVPAPVTPAFSFSKNCVNHSTEFNDNTTATTDPITTREWVFDELGSAYGIEANFLFPTTGTYDVSLNITTESGCEYSTVKNITIYDPPVAGFTATAESGIPPLAVTLTNEGSGIYQYHWTINTEQDTITPGNTFQTTFNQFGEHVIDLTVTDERNCTNSFSRIVTVLKPVVDVSLSSFITTEELDGTVKFILTIKNSGNTSIHDLDLFMNIDDLELKEVIGGPVLPGTTITYIPSFEITKSSQVEYVCASISFPDDMNTTDNRLCTSLKSEDKAVVFTPYPNPCTDFITVDWIAGETHSTNMEIIDALGHQRLSAVHTSQEGLNQVRIDLTTLESGVYFMMIGSGNDRRTHRFLVQR